MNIPLRLSRLSGVARATVPEKQSPLGKSAVRREKSHGSKRLVGEGDFAVVILGAEIKEVAEVLAAELLL